MRLFLRLLSQWSRLSTIVLVVATLTGWKPAEFGTTAAVVLLAMIVLTIASLLSRGPAHFLQLVISVLLLLSGIG